MTEQTDDIPQSTAGLKESWNQVAAGYDSFVTPTHMALAEEGLRRAGLTHDMRFLDVAAGSGALSVPAARMGAQVFATDVSPSMLERLAARAREEGLEVETCVMDGQDLELDDNTFDMSGSQFGVMLFPDMPRGIAELARVTRPGGRVLMTVLGPPDEVEFFRFFVRAVQTVVPDFTAPDPPPLPFQLQSPERLRRELDQAGLTDVTVDTVTEELRFPSGRELWDWLTASNPVVEGVLAELGLSTEQRAAVAKALDDMVRERAGDDGPAVLTNAINVGIGTK